MDHAVPHDPKRKLAYPSQPFKKFIPHAVSNGITIKLAIRYNFNSANSRTRLVIAGSTGRRSIELAP
jgi:hypothetical protein